MNRAQAPSADAALRQAVNEMTLRKMDGRVSGSPRLKSPAPAQSDALHQAARAIREGKNFLVTSHLRPDGDNLGALTAILLILRRLGKPYRAVNRGPIPENMFFLPLVDEVVISEDCGEPSDVCIVLDTPTLDRTGYDWKQQWPAGTVINIDHHPGGEFYGDINVVDTSAPASCYLVYELAGILGIEMTPDLATCLYTGLMTDTGQFRYPNATQETFRVAAHLIDRGAPHSEIYKAVYEQQSLASLSLQGMAFSAMNRRHHDRLIWIEITRDMLRQAGANPTDVSTIVSKLTTIQGVRIGMTLEEKADDQTLVELRSVGDIDVGQIAQRFGGGGHKNASGCCYPGPLPEIRDRLLEAIAEIL